MGKIKMTKVGVTKALLNMGHNKTKVNTMVNANYAYVKRVYSGQGITNKTAANIIMSLPIKSNYTR